jgi:HAD superfamily hydrolase (TIGR01549 family)
MKRGIIFDCDGTLINSIGKTMESFQYALRQVDKKIYTDNEIKKYFGSGADRIFLNLLKDKKKSEAAFEYYLAHQLELAQEIDLHYGISELLDVIQENIIPTAVVTGRHARDLEIVLARHELSPRFVTLIADNDISKSKPSPEGILLAAKRMGLDPADTFYVGDSIIDLQAARAAGSKSIAALWDDLTVLEEMENAQPDFIAHTPMEVWEHFLQGKS